MAKATSSASLVSWIPVRLAGVIGFDRMEGCVFLNELTWALLHSYNSF
ncbi:MAG: hypothetical protein ACM3PY_02835 [Omnitrophica WOR_2 bacterium]